MHFGENQLSRSLIGLSPLTHRSSPRFSTLVGSVLHAVLPALQPAHALDHSASGLQHATTNALFRLAFATAPPHGLTSPHTITRRLILQKARSHITNKASLLTLLRLVGTRFQVLFHDPSPGRFSPFPHGTCSLSVIREYLGLPGGPGRFTQDFSGPVLLGIPSNSRQDFAYPDSHGLRRHFPEASTTPPISYCLERRQPPPEGPTTPHTQRLPAITRARFSLIRFRSPLLTESLFVFSSYGY